MDKKAKDLLKIMNVLIELHKSLLIIEEKKIGAIINQDWKTMEELLKEGEFTLSEIERSEVARKNILKNMGYDLNVPISQLSESLPESIYRDLKSSRESLVAVIDKLRNVNGRIKELLEDSLEIINFTLGLISNGNKTTKTYGDSGKEITENKTTSSFVLDFKA